MNNMKRKKVFTKKENRTPYTYTVVKEAPAFFTDILVPDREKYMNDYCVIHPNLLDKTLSVVVDIRKKREGRLLKNNPDVVRICNAIKGKYDRVRYKAAIWGESGKFFADILIEHENNVFCVVSKELDMSVSKIKWFWKVLEEVFPNKTVKVIPLEAEAARKSSHSFQQLLLDTIK
jgi:hypothetical protein